jgi:hypothetical protein
MNNTTNSWEEKTEIITEQIVIHYANFSGRESENRAAFRNAVRPIIRTLLHDTEIAAREEFLRDYDPEIKHHREQARKEALEECYHHTYWNSVSIAELLEKAKADAREEIKKEIEKWVSENTEISDMIHKSAILTSLLSSLTKE